MMAADGDYHHLCKLMAPVRHRWSINDVIGGIRNTVMPSDCSPVRFGIRSLLPPYSPELNPLELIWADIKQWVAGQNTTFNLEQVMKLCQQRVDGISVAKWEIVCEHVEKIEDEYIEQEGIMENVIESFIITGGDSSSESDDDEDDDNENHDDNGGDISGTESLSDE
ncbi:hypothetical protein ANN_06488 [Periplaneta americana]|uniref:Tc1-like transposase DDE domain-containing protein n=1 Tax=Periplaneta americana TaxID=6978 RepID=A0ABQ8TFA3_PERAM|nr:hypothetical protein ANN_06488 [Periplaneta americana]